MANIIEDKDGSLLVKIEKSNVRGKKYTRQALRTARELYITTDLTLTAVAENTNISVKILQRIAKEEKWKEKREEYKEKTFEKIITKTTETLTNRYTKNRVELFAMAEKAIEKLKEIDIDNANIKVIDKYIQIIQNANFTMQKIADTYSAFVDRKLNIEEQKVQIEREKLNILRERYATLGENDIVSINIPAKIQSSTLIDDTNDKKWAISDENNEGV